MCYIIEHSVLRFIEVIVLPFDYKDHVVIHNLQVVGCLQILLNKKTKIKMTTLYFIQFWTLILQSFADSYQLVGTQS